MLLILLLTAVIAEPSPAERPLYFIENQGQMPADVHFYLLGENKTLFFSSEGITFQVRDHDHRGSNHIFRLDFLASHTRVKIMGLNRQPTRFNYFKGNPAAWKTGIPTYQTITYQDLWPGVDLVFHGATDRIKYEFVIQPDADPDFIRLTYQGISKLGIDSTGALEVTTAAGAIKDSAPLAYQVIKGERVPVQARYCLEEKTEDSSFNYGFKLGAYDRDKPLILDPALLVYCGYLGGLGDDAGNSIVVDRAGSVYITGETYSDELSFPVQTGPDLTHNGLNDAFVTKISPDGIVEYCTFLGGGGNDAGYGIALDAKGRVYIAGMTESSETSFPVKNGPGLIYQGNGDGFLARLSANGTHLDYCGYLGGSELDWILDLDVNSKGNLFVTGKTESDETSFPVHIGPNLAYGGGMDGFVARVNTRGTALDYCGYIGGQEYDAASDVVIDNRDRAFLVGISGSNEDTFPVKIGPDLTFNGDLDAFAARVNSRGTGLDYCGYIGGSEMDYASRNALDAEGNLYLAGSTDSDEATFPVHIGPDLTFNGGASGGADSFVARINTQGTALDFCGYIGGNLKDKGYGIAVDHQGSVYVTGWTRSMEDTFPVRGGPDLTHNGDRDAFIARLNPKWTGLDYCGYIGGSGRDWALDIDVDRTGNAFITGWTRSDETSFPIMSGPDLSYNGQMDAFIAKITPSLWSDAKTLSAATGGSALFKLCAGKNSGNRPYLLLGSASGTEPGIPLPGGAVTLPLNWDFFSQVIISKINSPLFSGFQGYLDGQGSSTAQLNLRPIPNALGLTLHFAYALDEPMNFASNPVQIEVVP